MISHDWRLRQHSNRLSSHLSDKHFSILRHLHERPVRETYKLLEFYYQQNGLYEEIGDLMVSAGMSYRQVRGLRNPCNRVVEAYADNLWPGPLNTAMMVVSENARLSDELIRLWQWSNWGSLKQRAARWLGLFGDMFVKVATNAKDDRGFTRVYLQLIKPAQVTDFALDERGFVISLRLDQLIQGEKGLKWHTEHWDKASQRMRIWKHSQGFDKSLDGLGKPTTDAEFAEFGIDFVPFVFAPLRDDGLGRCAGAFTHALDKINEANQQATELHKRLFRYNRPDMALEGTGQDSAGRPLPPPRVGSSDDQREIEISGERFYRLPSGWKISHLVAQLDYNSALAILEAHMRELENDLPELVYDRLKNKDSISGRALRIMASKALKRFEEARGNAGEALTRAHSMALTMGSNAGFWDVGNYEAGDFQHSLRFPEIVPITVEERATTFTMLVGGGAPIRWALKQAGWSDADLEEFDKEMEDARTRDSGNDSGDDSRDSGDSRDSRDSGDSGDSRDGFTAISRS